MKKVNYYYEKTGEGYLIDWRQMPIKNKLKLIYLLLTKQKIHIIGENKIEVKDENKKNK